MKYLKMIMTVVVVFTVGVGVAYANDGSSVIGMGNITGSFVDLNSNGVWDVGEPAAGLDDGNVLSDEELAEVIETAREAVDMMVQDDGEISWWYWWGGGENEIEDHIVFDGFQLLADGSYKVFVGVDDLIFEVHVLQGVDYSGEEYWYSNEITISDPSGNYPSKIQNQVAELLGCDASSFNVNTSFWGYWWTVYNRVDGTMYWNGSVAINGRTLWLSGNYDVETLNAGINPYYADRIIAVKDAIKANLGENEEIRITGVDWMYIEAQAADLTIKYACRYLYGEASVPVLYSLKNASGVDLYRAARIYLAELLDTYYGNLKVDNYSLTDDGKVKFVLMADGQSYDVLVDTSTGEATCLELDEVIETAREAVDMLVQDDGEALWYWYGSGSESEIEDHIEFWKLERLVDGNYKVFVKVDNFIFEVDMRKYVNYLGEEYWYSGEITISDTTGNYPSEIQRQVAELLNCDADSVKVNTSFWGYWWGTVYNRIDGTMYWDGSVTINGKTMWLSGNYDLETLDAGINPYYADRIIAVKDAIKANLGENEAISITGVDWMYIEAQAADLTIKYACQYRYGEASVPVLYSMKNASGVDLYRAARIYLAELLDTYYGNLKVDNYSLTDDGKVKFVLMADGQSYDVLVDMSTGEIVDCEYGEVIEEAREAVDWLVLDEGESYWGDTEIEDHIEFVRLEKIEDGKYKVFVKVDDLEFEVEVKRYVGWNGEGYWYGWATGVIDMAGNFPSEIQQQVAELFNCETGDVEVTPALWGGMMMYGIPFYDRVEGTLAWDGLVKVDGRNIWLSWCSYDMNTHDAGISPSIEKPILTVKDHIAEKLNVEIEDIRITNVGYSYVTAEAADLTINYYCRYSYSDDAVTELLVTSLKNSDGMDLYGIVTGYLSTVFDEYHVECGDYSLTEDGGITFIVRSKNTEGVEYEMTIDLATGEIRRDMKDDAGLIARRMVDEMVTEEGENYWDGVIEDYIVVMSVSDPVDGVFNVIVGVDDLEFAIEVEIKQNYSGYYLGSTQFTDLASASGDYPNAIAEQLRELFNCDADAVIAINNDGRFEPEYDRTAGTITWTSKVTIDGLTSYIEGTFDKNTLDAGIESGIKDLIDAVKGDIIGNLGEGTEIRITYAGMDWWFWNEMVYVEAAGLEMKYISSYEWDPEIGQYVLDDVELDSLSNESGSDLLVAAKDYLSDLLDGYYSWDIKVDSYSLTDDGKISFMLTTEGEDSEVYEILVDIATGGVTSPEIDDVIEMARKVVDYLVLDEGESEIDYWWYYNDEEREDHIIFESMKKLGNGKYEVLVNVDDFKFTVEVGAGGGYIIGVSVSDTSGKYPSKIQQHAAELFNCSEEAVKIDLELGWAYYGWWECYSIFHDRVEGTILWEGSVEIGENSIYLSGTYDVNTCDPGLGAAIEEAILAVKDVIRGNLGEVDIRIVDVGYWYVDAKVADVTIEYYCYHNGDEVTGTDLRSIKNASDQDLLQLAESYLSNVLDVSYPNCESYSLSEDGGDIVFIMKSGDEEYEMTVDVATGKVEREMQDDAGLIAMEMVDDMVYDWDWWTGHYEDPGIDDYIILVSIEETGDGVYLAVIGVDDLEFSVEVEIKPDSYDNYRVDTQLIALASADGAYPNNIKDRLVELFNCDNEVVSINSYTYDKIARTITWGGVIVVGDWTSYINGAFGLDTLDLGIEGGIEISIEAVKEDIVVNLGADTSVRIERVYGSSSPTVYAMAEGLEIRYYSGCRYDYEIEGYVMDELELGSVKNADGLDVYGIVKDYLSRAFGVSNAECDSYSLTEDGSITFIVKSGDEGYEVTIDLTTGEIYRDMKDDAGLIARDMVDDLVTDEGEDGSIEDYIELVSVSDPVDDIYSVIISVDDLEFAVEVEIKQDNYGYYRVSTQLTDLASASGDYPNAIAEQLAELFNCDDAVIAINDDNWFEPEYDRTDGTVTWTSKVTIDGLTSYIEGTFDKNTLDAGIESGIKDSIEGAKEDIIANLGEGTEVKITYAGLDWWYWNERVYAEAADLEMQYISRYEWDLEAGQNLFSGVELDSLSNESGSDLLQAAKYHLGDLLEGYGYLDLNVDSYSLTADGEVRFVLAIGEEDRRYEVLVDIITGDVTSCSELDEMAGEEETGVEIAAEPAGVVPTEGTNDEQESKIDPELEAELLSKTASHIASWTQAADDLFTSKMVDESGVADAPLKKVPEGQGASN